MKKQPPPRKDYKEKHMAKKITKDNVSELLNDDEGCLIYPLLDESFLDNNDVYIEDVNSENKMSVFERIFIMYIKRENGYQDNNVIILKMIDEGLWDISKKDKFNRNSVDYMNDLVKSFDDIKFLNFYSKYSDLLKCINNGSLIDSNTFIQSMLDEETINPRFFINTWDRIYSIGSGVTLLQNENFRRCLKDNDFAYKMSSILSEKLKSALFGFSKLVKIFQSPLHHSDISETLKTKNIKETFDNVDYCSQKVKNGYANFGLLYSNASDIDDKSIYTSTFIKTIHELRNVNNSSIPDEEAAQIYSELMKFYSYDVILDNDYLREELRFFIDNVNNHYRDSMYKDYKENYTEYEKRKIQKVVKADTIKVSKKRI